MTRAVVSGRYANAVTRAVALAADIALLAGCWAGSVWILKVLVDYFFSEPIPKGPGWVTSVLFMLSTVAYTALCTAIAGRTIGKALIGLRVVRLDGGPVGPGRSLVRGFLVVVLAPVAWVSAAAVVLGRRHRSLHDLVAGTAVVYDWGDRPAELSAPLTAYLRRHDSL